MNLELEAYQHGDRKLLFELIMQDPWTRSQQQANALLESILALPYHEEMRRHFRN